MVELDVIALGNKVLLSYDNPFIHHIPEKFSFSFFLPIDEYKGKLQKVKRDEPVIIDGPYGKVQVSKNGYAYNISLIPDSIPVILKSCYPYQDLRI